MTAIGNITGIAPTINATTGAITLHTGTAQNLNITQLVARVLRARLLVTRHGCPRRRRYGRHRRGHRQRHHHLHQRIDLRRCGDCLQCRRHAGEPAIALGQDRQLGARRRPSGRLESVLSDQHHCHGHAGRLGQRRHQLHLQCQRFAGVTDGIVDQHPWRRRRRSIARSPFIQHVLRCADAVREHERCRDHQHHHAKRLCRRSVAVGRHQQQWHRGRHVLQWPKYRSGLGDAVAFQRHQLSEVP